MRRRRHRNKRGKNHTVRNIVISCFVITLLFATGYGAFQTVIKINVKGNVKRYTVTFDANGGLLDNRTKFVGLTYGELPTPTREGYTFKGWNGKNMFDATKGENGYVDPNGTISNTSFNFLSDYIQISKEHTYIISGNIEFFNIGIAYFDLDKTFLSRANNLNMQNLYINPTTDGFIRFWISVDNIMSLDYSLISETYNVQLEKDVISDYEPYYITSDTKVIQKKNHTLIAIWEEEI